MNRVIPGLYIIIVTCLLAMVFIDTHAIRSIAAIVSFLASSILFFQFRKFTSCDYVLPDNTASTIDYSHEVNEVLIELVDTLESAVKEDLFIVKQELNQIKGLVNNATSELTECFYSLSSDSDAQIDIVHALKDTLYSKDNREILYKLDQLQKQIKNSKAAAVRALQFEDIVIQVSDNSIQYLENLDLFLNEYRKRLTYSINNPHQSSDSSSQIKSYVDDVKKIRQARQLPDRKAVNQNDLSEGGIELF